MIFLQMWWQRFHPFIHLCIDLEELLDPKLSMVQAAVVRGVEQHMKLDLGEEI